MTETFLREVRLKDFRTFGEFTLPIPPGPGLTLLVGTNGLGKSSFFDAIEWCLTGSVRRFEAHVGRLRESEYLTRRDAKPGSHQASLSFTKGNPLIRTMSESPSAQALADLLKDPDWADIKDVGAYLGFTHFLGQASQQRFTSRDQSDQWQALKGPSGIDRLESIRTALRGRTKVLEAPIDRTARWRVPMPHEIHPNFANSVLPRLSAFARTERTFRTAAMSHHRTTMPQLGLMPHHTPAAARGPRMALEDAPT